FGIPFPREPQWVPGRSMMMRRQYQVIATGDGFGADWREIDPTATNAELELRLVRDSLPIAGRILNLEGRPVAGVRIRVRTLGTSTTNLDDWITRARKIPPVRDGSTGQFFSIGKYWGIARNDAAFPGVNRIDADPLPGPSTAVTGPDGKFTITG